MDIMFVAPKRLKFAFETQFTHIKGLQTTLEPSPKIQDGDKKRLCGAKFKIRFTKLPFFPCYHKYL